MPRIANKKTTTTTTISRAKPRRRTTTTRYIRGSGSFNYKPYLKKALISGGRMTGRTLGTYIGMPKTGAKFGAKLGGVISRLVGSGAYQHNMNDLKMNSLFYEGPPKFQSVSTSPGDIIITHSEFVTDVFSGPVANTFSPQVYYINAGSQFFAWLSQISANYTEYEFQGMACFFKSSTSDSLLSSSTSSYLGTVMLAFNSNVLEPPFTSKFQMQNIMGAVSCKPSENALCGLECLRSENISNNLLVRFGAGPAQNNNPDYDIATFTLATISPLINTNLGELYASYTCKLLKPKIWASLGNSSLALHGTFASPSLANIFGGTRNISVNSSLAATFSFNTITLPFDISGNFRFTLLFQGTTTGNFNVAPSFGSISGQLFSIYGTTSQSFSYTPTLGTASDRMSVDVIIAFNNTQQSTVAPNVTFNLSGSIPGSTNAYVELWVQQIPNIITS